MRPYGLVIYRTPIYGKDNDMQKNIRNEILNYSKGYHLSTFFKYVDHKFGGIKNNPDIKNIGDVLDN